jgi:hypothetical protein
MLLIKLIKNMKNNKSLILVCLIAFSIVGCKKSRLPEGNYTYEWSIITTDSVIFNSCEINGVYLEVIESNKDFIIFATNDTLYKAGQAVSGTFRGTGATICHGHNIFFGEKHLSGTSKKEKGVHYINGTITTIVYGPKENNGIVVWDTVSAEGTFELKSIF